MSAKGHKFPINFHNMRLQVFAQFLIVIIILLALILISSNSFYTSMIESMTISSLKNSIAELNDCDLDSAGVVSRIEDIERQNSVIFEIYGKETPKDTNYNKKIYIKYSHGIYYKTSADYARYELFRPMVDFNKNEFDVIKKLSETSSVGTLINKTSQYKYFSMVSISDDGNYKFVSSIRYAIIDAQAHSISLSVNVICMIVFIIISLSAYFFITRIMKPLRTINTYVEEMVVHEDASIRIPVRNRRLLNEVDSATSNINCLYESLILTKEMLEEKTEVLLTELSLRDSEQKHREEFIADTSHELKTPISIIQGYAEGAKFILDDKKALNEYCDTIIEECVRMNSLVVSMMSLSDIKHNSNNLNVERFSINEYVSKKISLHEMIFKKNSITVENNLKDEIYGVADLSKFSFVINNLISNAISYCDGEKIISFRYEDVGLSYRLFVFNSSKPIPQNKLEELWQSFYRVDTARIRSQGHFGLGLSIIKAVQDAHSQQSGVDNVEGGVEFWVDIQKDET